MPLALMVAVIVTQRITELRRARANERWARSQGAVEVGAAHYPAFFVLHTAWLLGWIIEALLRGSGLTRAWPIWFLVFLGAEGLRYWAMSSLGRRWNTRILVLPGAPLVTRGPYRVLRHPNYVAVALELASVPLMFGAWVTALASSLLNAALLLAVRIPAEERALGLSAAERGERPEQDQ